MRELAPGVHQLRGFPPDAINAYLVGDVLTNVDLRTGKVGLHEPLPAFTADPPRNHPSARRLAELEPSLVVFGHGPPLRDPRALREFAERLPASGS